MKKGECWYEVIKKLNNLEKNILKNFENNSKLSNDISKLKNDFEELHTIIINHVNTNYPNSNE